MTPDLVTRGLGSTGRIAAVRRFDGRGALQCASRGINERNGGEQPMTDRRLLRARVIVGVLLAIGLVACGDSEATQRKAFIEFLQTRIIGKPGVHVPKLTEQETAAFGAYAGHYAVIADFNAGLDEAVSKPMERALEAAP